MTLGFYEILYGQRLARINMQQSLQMQTSAQAALKTSLLRTDLGRAIEEQLYAPETLSSML